MDVGRWQVLFGLTRKTGYHKNNICDVCTLYVTFPAVRIEMTPIALQSSQQIELDERLLPSGTHNWCLYMHDFCQRVRQKHAFKSNDLLECSFNVPSIDFDV